MALKSKFERIDQSKLKQGARDVLAKMKEKSENFTNAEVNKKIEPAIDKLIERLKKENPDALKKASPTRTQKPKATAKKKATKKAPVKKGGAKRETVMTVAKRIRKDGEKWQDALKRAKSEMGKDTKKKVSAVKTEVDKLKKLIQEDAVLKGFANSELQRDAVRKAKPRGKRKTTTKGETTNQYGTFKNKVGRTYWESRENRSDRYAPKFPKNKPYLELGGDVTDSQDLSIANADFLVMAKGGMVDYSKDGYVKAIRNIDGKMIKEVVVDGVKYRRNSTYNTYNSIKDNEILHKNKYAKGGLVELKSVGSLIDVKKGLIYPQYENGKADFSNPISLRDEEVSSDWYESLSPQDYKVVEKATKSFAKGGEIDAFTMSMVKGVDDGISEVKTKDLKARMEKGGQTQGKIYKIQQKSKYDLGVPKWEDEKFLTGGKKYLSYKDAQDVKKKLQRMSSSIQYKVVEWTPKLGFAKGGEIDDFVTVFMFGLEKDADDFFEMADKFTDYDVLRLSPFAIQYTGGKDGLDFLYERASNYESNLLDIYAKGGLTARGKSGRYHILGESSSAKQPFFYASTDDRASIKSLVSDAKKVFKDLGAKNVEVFVTDQKEDRKIYENQYAKGGEMSELKKGQRVRIFNTQYDGKQGLIVAGETDGKYSVQLEDGKVKGIERQNLMLLSRDIFSKGGEIDLFEDYQSQPKELSEIVEKYEERYADGDMDYKDTEKFLKEVNAIGYTFDSGLDNEPYNLRPMMAKGGEIEYYEDGEPKLDTMQKEKMLKPLDDYGYYLKIGNIIHYYDNNKNWETSKIGYAKGGEINPKRQRLIDKIKNIEEEILFISKNPEAEEQYFKELNDDLAETKKRLANFYNVPENVMAKGGELQGADISRLRKNIMGTLSFDLKVGSMRKAQDFIVYPMSELEDKISIQSSKKFGIISIEDGRGILSKGNGNTFMHLRRDMAMRNVITFKLTSSQLEELKNEIRKTGGSKVGNSVIFSDNSGASLLAKGGEAEGYSKFRVVFYNYSGETEEKEFDYYSDAYDYYNEAVDDEVGGGTTTIILQGYSDKYDQFEDIFYFDPMEMTEEEDDFAKGGRLKSALMRDRKYYNKNEAWERAYSKGKNRRGYKENGGVIENSIQSYQNHYKGFPSYEDGGTIADSTQHFRIMETDTPIYKEGGQIDMDL